MLMLPCFASKQTYARIDYLRTDDNWWGEKTLIVLNFSLKTIQNKSTVNSRGWATTRKKVGLRRPAQAVAGHAAHGQQQQHHGNAEIIGHQQVIFSLWKPHGITSALPPFKTSPRFATNKWSRNSYFIVSLSGTSYTYRVISLVLQHKDINSPQFVEIVCRNTKI